MSEKFIPYGRQTIAEEDLAAVRDVLLSDWLTTGPKVGAFEKEFAAFCGAGQAVAVNSGTAALHCAMNAIGVGPGDEVIVPAITFAATANAAIYEGATPVFADIEADTLLIDPDNIAERITPKTKAIAAVDYAGQPADYDAIQEIAATHGLRIIADACHSPGATYKGRSVGTLADISAFSFHPVKHITTGEGGLATTDDGALAETMRRFRNHGIDTDHKMRAERGLFAYDMAVLGYNYRLNDIQCALGMAQLSRLRQWVAARQAIAARYDVAFAAMEHVAPLVTRADRTNAHHLYVIRLAGGSEGYRDRAFAQLRDRGIGANVHYAPVYYHSYYKNRFGHGPGLCPVAEEVYETILTLPVYPTMTESDADRVIAEVDALSSLA